MPDRTNASWFFIAFIGGGVGVWWAKDAFQNAWIAALVAGGVVAALTVHYVRNEMDTPEEKGDYVYYLGLLFTLFSLMLSLVYLFGLGADVEPGAAEIRDLLKNFGIALTSTVVGIAGRIAVQSWGRRGAAELPGLADGETGPDKPSSDASARDLETFNRHLLQNIARDLTQGANALARFHRIVRKHASDTEEYLRDHSERLKREDTAFRDEVQRDAKAFAQELRNRAESTAEAVEGLRNVAEASAELGSNVQRATRSTKDLELEVQKLGVALQQIGEVFRTINAEREQATQQSAQSAEHFDALAENVRVAEKETLRATEALRALADEAETRTKALRRLGGSVSSLLKRFAFLKRLAFWRRPA